MGKRHGLLAGKRRKKNPANPLMDNCFGKNDVHRLFPLLLRFLFGTVLSVCAIRIAFLSLRAFAIFRT
ncbi:MAG: hypothetical protein LBI69_03050 [Puniceicoccales bacterium]|nr:hypothetical protein [Puniceicoccales bacterium]